MKKMVIFSLLLSCIGRIFGQTEPLVSRDNPTTIPVADSAVQASIVDNRPNAHLVEAFLVNGWKKTNEANKSLVGVALIKKGPKLNTAQTAKLMDILKKAKVNNIGMSKKCEFAPEVALHIKTKDSSTTILIALSCDIWEFTEKYGKTKYDADAVHSPTMALFVEVFGKQALDAHFKNIDGGKGVLKDPFENSAPPIAPQDTMHRQPAPPVTPPNTSRHSVPQTIVYRVKEGDTLNSIAKAHKVSVLELKKWNKLTKDAIHPTLDITIHPKQ